MRLLVNIQLFLTGNRLLLDAEIPINVRCFYQTQAAKLPTKSPINVVGCGSHTHSFQSELDLELCGAEVAAVRVLCPRGCPGMAGCPISWYLLVNGVQISGMQPGISGSAHLVLR